MKKIIEISGEIGWDITAGEVKNFLKDATGDIEAVFSSGGGSVFDGVAMANAFREYDKGKTTAIISSIGASMASYIPLSFDEVVAHDNATYMIHNVSTFAWGDHKELRKSADVAEGLTNLLANAYVSKTGKNKDEILQMMDDETWLFGQEIMDAGFVDAIISTEGDKDKQSMVAVAQNNFSNTMKSAEEHHRADESQEKMVALMDTLKMMGTNPSASATQIDKNSGKESDLELQAKLDKANEELKASLEANSTLNDSLLVAKGKVESLTAQLETVGSEAKANAEKIVAMEAKASALPSIVAMAFEKGASKDTALAMMEKDTVESASVVLVDAMGEPVATTTPDAQTSVEENSEEKLTERCDALGVAFIS